jgi:hypothetical protein
LAKEDVRPYAKRLSFPDGYIVKTCQVRKSNGLQRPQSLGGFYF